MTNASSDAVAQIHDGRGSARYGTANTGLNMHTTRAVVQRQSRRQPVQHASCQLYNAIHYTTNTTLRHKLTVNPLKCTGIRWLHLLKWSMSSSSNLDGLHRRPRRARSAATYSDQTFPVDDLSVRASVRASVCPVHCGKTADRIRMPFGIIGLSDPGMRQIVGFEDRSTETVLLGGEFGARHCN